MDQECLLCLIAQFFKSIRNTLGFGLSNLVFEDSLY